MKKIELPSLAKFRHEPEDNTWILDNPEIWAKRSASHNYSMDKSTINAKAYADAVLNYLQWFQGYTYDILEGKIYKKSQMAQQLFIDHDLTEKQLKEYILTSLFAAKQYSEYLNSKITASNVHKYQQTLNSLAVNLEWLILHNEVVIRKSVPRATPSSGRRPHLSPDDIYTAARELFFIEEIEKIEDLPLRDLKPVVIFQIRQLIELFGKNLLGYSNIVDTTGQPIKKFTQIAWEFIALEVKKPDSKINLPFHVGDIIKMNKWANAFVHNTYIFNSYIQFFALDLLNILFVGAGKIKVYDGGIRSSSDFSDIKLYHYHQLRSDFEDYLVLKLPEAARKPIVNWLPEKKVGAYIVTLN